MIKCTHRLFLLLTVLLVAEPSKAVQSVNPSGVNVRSSGATSVFLTFRGLDPNEQSMEAFWCGTLIAPLPPNQVFNFNPCDPSTIFGRLPANLNLSQDSGTGGQRNLTDIMSIPASVTRRAFQAAQSGSASQFFYVRRFSSGQFAVVTCRMAGGGARTPLALMDVRIGFQESNNDVYIDPTYTVTRGGQLPALAAKIKYNGAGQLRGRWEVMMPGDPTPTDNDLLTEATLPVEQRGLQRRYTFIERFDVFLPPVGEAIIPGPNPNKIPTYAAGLHQILFRVEASGGRDSSSNTGDGKIAFTGGVAGFPMPVLRYFVGTSDTSSSRQALGVSLLSPSAQTNLTAKSMDFTWSGAANASFYRLEVQDESGAEVVSAMLQADALQYAAPPWLSERTGETLRWRIVALNAAGAQLVATDWKTFQIAAE